MEIKYTKRAEPPEDPDPMPPTPAPPLPNESGEEYRKRCGPFTEVGKGVFHHTTLIDWMIRTGKKPEGLDDRLAYDMIEARMSRNGSPPSNCRPCLSPTAPPTRSSDLRRELMETQCDYCRQLSQGSRCPSCGAGKQPHTSKKQK